MLNPALFRRRNGTTRGASAPRSFSPRLEVLEERALLSTYIVDHLADDSVGSGSSGSLRYALSNAVSGDTITFSVTGTINLNSALPELSRNLTIQGPGAGSLTVRRNTGGNYRIFTVDGGANVSISGLTVSNGRAAGQGGGIANFGTLTLVNVSVSDNLTVGYDNDYGGGIYNTGTLTVQNSALTRNTAEGVLPGWFGVETGFGGGLSVAGGTVTVNRTTLSGNTTIGPGGGIHLVNGAVTVNSSTIAGNTASGPYGEGGAIDMDGGTVTINTSTLAGNHADDKGGAIFNLGTLTVNSSTIAGNTASQIVGGIANADPWSWAWWISGTLNLGNTILAGNTDGAGVPDLYGSLASSGYNLVGDGDTGDGFAASDLVGSGDTLIDPTLGPLQDNGGPTQTMALLAGSPALNAGDPGQLGMADQRGVLRRGGVNIGAYQASASAFVLTAPTAVTAGAPFDVTVQAVDPFGKVALGYRSTITFSATDPNSAVVLPATYMFTAADAGLHTFAGGLTLLTPGPQTLTATDTVSGISGSLTVHL
jgi:hypothetical protein